MELRNSISRLYLISSWTFSSSAWQSLILYLLRGGCWKLETELYIPVVSRRRYVSLGRCGKEFGNWLHVYFLQEIIQSVLYVGWLLIYFFRPTCLIRTLSPQYIWQYSLKWIKYFSKLILGFKRRFRLTIDCCVWTFPHTTRNNCFKAEVWI